MASRRMPRRSVRTEDLAVIRFGQALREIRQRRELSRDDLLMRVDSIVADDANLVERIGSKGWRFGESLIARLENGDLARLPEWLVEPLIQALECTPEERRTLLECLVPGVVVKYLGLPREPPAKPVKRRGRRGRPKSEGLPPRPRELLALAATGMSNAEIQEKLSIEKSTLDTHWSRAIRELEARDREHAIELALERGLI